MPVPTALAIQKEERLSNGLPKDGKIRIGIPETIFPTETLARVGLISLTVADCTLGCGNPGIFQDVIPVNDRLKVSDASFHLPTPVPLALAGPPPLLNPRNRQLIANESAVPEKVPDKVPPARMFRIGTVPEEMIVNDRVPDEEGGPGGHDRDHAALDVRGTIATRIARSKVTHWIFRFRDSAIYASLP